MWVLEWRWEWDDGHQELLFINSMKVIRNDTHELLFHVCNFLDISSLRLNENTWPGMKKCLGALGITLLITITNPRSLRRHSNHLLAGDSISFHLSLLHRQEGQTETNRMTSFVTEMESRDHWNVSHQHFSIITGRIQTRDDYLQTSSN